MWFQGSVALGLLARHQGSVALGLLGMRGGRALVLAVAVVMSAAARACDDGCACETRAPSSLGWGCEARPRNACIGCVGSVGVGVGVGVAWSEDREAQLNRSGSCAVGEAVDTDCDGGWYSIGAPREGSAAVSGVVVDVVAAGVDGVRSASAQGEPRQEQAEEFFLANAAGESRDKQELDSGVLVKSDGPQSHSNVEVGDEASLGVPLVSSRPDFVSRAFAKNTSASCFFRSFIDRACNPETQRERVRCLACRRRGYAVGAVW